MEWVQNMLTGVESLIYAIILILMYRIFIKCECGTYEKRRNAWYTIVAFISLAWFFAVCASLA